MRLDCYLFEKRLARSRTYASDMIKEGRVLVSGKTILKPAYDVSDETVEVIARKQEYVSRGAYKLLSAFQEFQLSAEHKIIADIGASTGGFSDVVLKDHAEKVYAIDVGTLQLDASLRSHPRLVSMENTNALDLTADMFKEKIDLVVMDVSFVSVKTLLPHLIALFESAEFVVLIKPQFEVGKKHIGKGGIVKDKKIHQALLLDIYDYLQSLLCQIHGICASSTKGKDGNQEYFVYFSKSCSKRSMDRTSIKKLF